MQIRKMVLADYDRIYQLWLSTPGMGLNEIDDSREGIRKYLDRNPDTSFIAESEGVMIGTILCGHDGRRGFIYHLAVDMDARQQGVGRKLVDAALEALQSQGIIKAALVVFRNNALGNSFWESVGFPERSDLIYRNKSLQDN